MITHDFYVIINEAGLMVGDQIKSRCALYTNLMEAERELRVAQRQNPQMRLLPVRVVEREEER
jgi:hypothetical protein